MPDRTIFYSWQAQLPNSTNRGFIRDALDAAVAELASSEKVEDSPRPEDSPYENQALIIQSATEGVPGTPDIAATIIERITAADIVMVDISIVNKEAVESAAKSIYAEI